MYHHANKVNAIIADYQRTKRRVTGVGKTAIFLLFYHGQGRWSKYMSPFNAPAATNRWLDMSVLPPGLQITISYDKQDLPKADIVLFPDEHLGHLKDTLQKVRPDQATAVWGLEPAVVESTIVAHRELRLDYIISFHSLSEIRVDYSHNIPLPLPSIYHAIFGEALTKRTDAVSATFISGCFPQLIRKKYFAALEEHNITIHHYGPCMHTPHLPRTPRTAEVKYLVTSLYRYCFAFENSVLHGYVTEKLYQALAADCVPVYFGAPDVRDVVHPIFRDVFILANEYTPRDLAALLRHPDTYPLYRQRQQSMIKAAERLGKDELWRMVTEYNFQQQGAKSFITRLIQKYLGNNTVV